MSVDVLLGKCAFKAIIKQQKMFFNFLFILSLKINLKYYRHYQTTTLSRVDINTSKFSTKYLQINRVN